MKRLSQIAVISFFLFCFTADSHAAWAPWGEPFSIIDGQTTILFDLKPDSKGGWVALLRAGTAEPYSLLLARVSISNITGQIEVNWADTGIKYYSYINKPGGAYNASLFTALERNLIALSTKEYDSSLNWVFVVRYYNLDLAQQGDAITFIRPSTSYGTTLTIRLDNPAAIFLLEGIRLLSNTVAIKYDLSGALLTGPTEVIHYQECSGGNSLWPTPDGGAFLKLGFGYCISCDGAPCPMFNPCMEVPTFVRLDKNLRAISGVTSPAVGMYFLEDSFIQIKQGADGNITALWETEAYTMGGIAGACFLTAAKKYLQVTDFNAGFVGDPLLIGDLAWGNYVYGYGTLALRPGGGFSLSDWYNRFPIYYPVPYTWYLYDSSGDLEEGPITISNGGYLGGDFDKSGFKFLALWKENSKTMARIIREEVNTLEGSSVAYTDSSGVTITFDTVTEGGNTEVNRTPQGPPTPNGFKMGAPPVYYEITTTAIFEGGATVCFSYDESWFSGPESRLRLFKYNPDEYSDVTTSLDTEANIICGRVDSFSTFMVTEPDPGFPIPRSNMTDTGSGSCSIGSRAGSAGDALPFLFLVLIGVYSRIARKRLQAKRFISCL